MLRPAVLFKDQIQKAIPDLFYTDDIYWYSQCDVAEMIFDAEKSDVGFTKYQYAIVSKDESEVIGYIAFSYMWHERIVRNFGFIAFKRNRPETAAAVKEVEKIIKDLKPHKVQFRMIGGNPVERHYDFIMKKYHGEKFVLKDDLRDKYGKYHDDIIYEIFFD